MTAVICVHSNLPRSTTIPWTLETDSNLTSDAVTSKAPGHAQVCQQLCRESSPCGSESQRHMNHKYRLDVAAILDHGTLTSDYEGETAVIRSLCGSRDMSHEPVVVTTLS